MPTHAHVITYVPMLAHTQMWLDMQRVKVWKFHFNILSISSNLQCNSGIIFISYILVKSDFHVLQIMLCNSSN